MILLKIVDVDCSHFMVPNGERGTLVLTKEIEPKEVKEVADISQTGLFGGRELISNGAYRTIESLTQVTDHFRFQGWTVTVAKK